MRHAKLRYELGRFPAWRRATLASLVKNLLVYQSIKTTKIRAKAAKPLADKLISLAKQNSLFAKRQAFKILNDHRLVSMLFKDIGTRFNNRVGGYTRILGLGNRRGDNAEMVIFELSEIKKKEARKPKKEKDTKLEDNPQVTEAKQQDGRAENKTEVAVKEKPPISKKPPKKFLGGIKNIFKKERDSL